MAEISNTQRKAILLDPVAEYSKPEFSKQGTQPSDDTIKALSELQQQYDETNAQLKTSQNKSKKISRKIGAAKREGQSSEELMQSMRQQSADNKKLKNQLNEITDSILNYFGDFNTQEKIAKHAAEPAATEPATDGIPAREHAKELPNHNQKNDQLSVALLSDQHKAWDQYVESNPDASLYHRSEWKKLIHDVFGHECFYFYASRKEEVVGILPLIRLNSRLFGDFMVSMPYFNSGGAIGNSLAIEQALMQAANTYAEKAGSTHIEYRDDIRRKELPARDEKVNMILSLPDSPDTLWKSFGSKLRSQIKRAQRENTHIEIAGIDNLSDFYTVFAEKMRDLGTPVYGKNFFKAILQRFEENSVIVVIHLNNKPVATAFLLGHKDTLEIPWASTIKEVNQLSINMLLYWEVLKFAVKNKYRYFDFGRSSKNSSTFRFKQQWGAKPKNCYWHYWLKDDAKMPSLNPNNPKYKLVIGLWKKLPIWMTKLIGPKIVKNLP